MIELAKLDKSYIDSVKRICLTEEQVKFASTAEAFLLGGNNTTHLHVIKSNGAVVGFFKLDIAYSSTYSFCPKNGIGLRGFALDQNQQGKGIGTCAVKALFPYLKTHYSNHNVIYLTVNCKNPGAKACYQKGGFKVSGEKYFGGVAGPQYIMCGKIT
jgi:RimJ/RimL family protein N-acetyltransferase